MTFHTCVFTVVFFSSSLVKNLLVFGAILSRLGLRVASTTREGQLPLPLSASVILDWDSLLLERNLLLPTMALIRCTLRWVSEHFIQVPRMTTNGIHRNSPTAQKKHVILATKEPPEPSRGTCRVLRVVCLSAPGVQLDTVPFLCRGYARAASILLVPRSEFSNHLLT